MNEVLAITDEARRAPQRVRGASTDAQELRWLADAYDQAQRTRLEIGERLRALLQQRDSNGRPDAAAEDADDALKLIRAGQRAAPIPLLGWTYMRHWEEEQELRRGMAVALDRHPIWPWLQDVRGIGPTLACKLLSRLDIHRAPTPSSFWAYCGLATTPGDEYACATCGVRLSFPIGSQVSGRHKRSGSSAACRDGLVLVRAAADGVRIAQPRPRRGQPMRYDQFAKKTCYLIGVSLIRSGGSYAEQYRAFRLQLEQERPGWPRARIHLAALRRIEKAFLADLWRAWRTATGLEVRNASA